MGRRYPNEIFYLGVNNEFPNREYSFINCIFFIIMINIGCTQPSEMGDELNATDIVFQSTVQTGGIDSTTESTGLSLIFDVDPITLTADHITVTGATKGALSGSGTTRNLAISDITVANGETLSIAIKNPPGYFINGSPKTAVIYREFYIGMIYKGGVIAYIFQPGDPGYVDRETHGLIASLKDQSTGIVWISGGGTQTTFIDGTGDALGTGLNNTNIIIAKAKAAGNHILSSYAAGIARDYKGGGYIDWYLPSKDELNKLFINRTEIGFSRFASDYYWSSSELTNTQAKFQCFSGGLQSFESKNLSYRVWPVRSF